MARFHPNPLLLAGVLSLGATCTAQSPANPCPSGQAASSDDAAANKTKKADQPAQANEAPCAPAAKEPSASQKFPFPGSSSAAPLAGSPSQSQAPDVPAPSGHRPSAAEEHPFPGSAPPMPGSDSSSSSNSGDGYSSSNDSAAPSGDAPADTPRTPGRRRLPKVEKLQTDEDRADEDLKVARFYEGKGDLNAAYMRIRDAVKALPNDSESHYALARIAEKLNKRDEAIAEYNAYLKMEPDGLNIKQADKALEQLQAK